ncbi:MAG: helix-turn-helix domain-containing protein [Chloroflexota bacterium]
MPATERVLDRATARGHRAVQELGVELAIARRAAGVSQRDVGAAAGVAASTVSRVERGLFRKCRCSSSRDSSVSWAST